MRQQVQRWNTKTGKWETTYERGPSRLAATSGGPRGPIWHRVTTLANLTYEKKKKRKTDD